MQKFSSFAVSSEMQLVNRILVSFQFWFCCPLLTSAIVRRDSDCQKLIKKKRKEMNRTDSRINCWMVSRHLGESNAGVQCVRWHKASNFSYLSTLRENGVVFSSASCSLFISFILMRTREGKKLTSVGSLLRNVSLRSLGNSWKYVFCVTRREKCSNLISTCSRWQKREEKRADRLYLRSDSARSAYLCIYIFLARKTYRCKLGNSTGGKIRWTNAPRTTCRRKISDERSGERERKEQSAVRSHLPMCFI